MVPRNSYHFSLGGYACFAIRDYSTTWPSALLAAGVDEQQLLRTLGDLGFPGSTIAIDYNCLFVDTGNHRVLIDAGWGSVVSERRGQLLHNLSAEGLSSTDIDHVVITHWDRDHVGGLLNEDGNLSFPNARYVMLNSAWTFWSGHCWPQAPEETLGFWRQLQRALADHVEQVEPDCEFLPGFALEPAQGHRRDHATLVISSDTSGLLHIADAAIHPALIEYADWCWPGHDSPQQAVIDKKRLLRRAARERCLVFGSHLPFPGLGHVTKSRNGWHWEQVVERAC